MDGEEIAELDDGDLRLPQNSRKKSSSIRGEFLAS
jgi:hypothetical protein